MFGSICHDTPFWGAFAAKTASWTPAKPKKMDTSNTKKAFLHTQESGGRVPGIGHLRVHTVWRRYA